MPLRPVAVRAVYKQNVNWGLRALRLSTMPAFYKKNSFSFGKSVSLGSSIKTTDMKRALFFMTVITVFVLMACSKKTSPGKTASEAPKPKPTTYTADVLPLIQMKCTPCHLPSKGGNKANFETYAAASKHGPDMIARIQLNPGDKGFMPFKHAKLAEEEIALFKKWVDGGMVEN